MSFKIEVLCDVYTSIGRGHQKVFPPRLLFIFIYFTQYVGKTEAKLVQERVKLFLFSDKARIP